MDNDDENKPADTTMTESWIINTLAYNDKKP